MNQTPVTIQTALTDKNGYIITDPFSFFQILSIPGIPQTSTIPNGSADDLFVFSYGDRIASNFLLRFCDDTGKLINPSNDFLALSSMINMRFKEKWAKLYKDFTAEYDPISNYNYTETEIIGRNGTRETATESNGSNTQSNVNTNESTSNSEVNIYAFNSSSQVPTDKGSGTGKETNRNNSTNVNTEKEKYTDTNRDNTTRTLSKSGDIGIQTPAWSIKQDVDLWHNWNYVEEVFEDILSLIALQIY